MTKDPAMRNISRREDRGSWRVQFNYPSIGLYEARTFTDNVYGSKEEALAAAQAYRDAFVAKNVDILAEARKGGIYRTHTHAARLMAEVKQVLTDAEVAERRDRNREAVAAARADVATVLNRYGVQP